MLHCSIQHRPPFKEVKVSIAAPWNISLPPTRAQASVVAEFAAETERVAEREGRSVLTRDRNLLERRVISVRAYRGIPCENTTVDTITAPKWPTGSRTGLAGVLFSRATISLHLHVSSLSHACATCGSKGSRPCVNI